MPLTVPKMEQAKELLRVTAEEPQFLSQHLPPLAHDSRFCFYEEFILRGIQVDRVELGLVVCIFKVPPRFIDRTGNLARGSIANLVDELGCAVAHTEDSVDTSVLDEGERPSSPPLDEGAFIEAKKSKCLQTKKNEVPMIQSNTICTDFVSDKQTQKSNIEPKMQQKQETSATVNRPPVSDDVSIQAKLEATKRKLNQMPRSKEQHGL